MAIKSELDLSAQLGPARDQGKRQTCVAFALSDMNRFHNGCAEPLSAEFIYLSAAHHDSHWAPHGGMSVLRGIDVLKTTGQPTEAAMPYSSTEPTGKPSVAPTSLPPLYKQAFHHRRPASSFVEQSLRAGLPVGVLTLLTPEFYMPVSGVITYSPNAIAKSNHAVVACGLGVDTATGETLINIRNSWGRAWGSDGYAWVTAPYIDQHSLLACRIL